MDANEIAEKFAPHYQLPFHSESWKKVIKEENVAGLRKLLKKERATLPPKYKKLYKRDDETIEILLHFIRTQFPFFTKQEKNKSKKRLNAIQLQRDGWANPIMDKKPF